MDGRALTTEDASGARQVAPCLLTGTVRSGPYPLPGVTLRFTPTDDRTGAPSETATSADGTFRIRLAPDAKYQLQSSLPPFADLRRDLELSGACPPSLDLSMTLSPPDAPGGAAATGISARTDAPVVRSEIARIAADLGVPDTFFAAFPTVLAEAAGELVRPDGGWWQGRRRAGPQGKPAPTVAEAAAERAAGARAAAARPATKKPASVPRAPVPQRAYQGMVEAAFNGSALDAPPYQLRPDRPVSRQPYQRQTFGVSLSGPLRLPGLYDGGRRTTAAITYAGQRGSNLFDQYATVPTEDIRAGDFSSVSAPLIDPSTGQPFSDRRIPAHRMHPAALALLRFIPAPNLPGTTRNFHHTATSLSTSNATTIRITHQLQVAAPGAKPTARSSASLVAQVQIRQNRSEQLNVFPALGGTNRTMTVAVPLTLNVQRGRTQHALRLDVSLSRTRAESRYAGVEDVAGEAGIAGLAREPFAWGVPALSFATYSSARDLNPSRRDDQRVVTGYTWTRTAGPHTITTGAEGRFDWSDNQTDPNARGTFVFTGRHTAGSNRVPRGAGFDFADFLLGLPQQASVQYGPGRVQIRGRALSVFAQDDWRRSSALTLTVGVRYEMVWPFVEARQQMVNLDVAPDFTQVTPVLAGGAGPFTGSFPAGLMEPDINNVAPRLALAWKGPRAWTLRGGYGVAFNSGPYSGIARQLVGQPPFAASQQSEGALTRPLDLADPFRAAEILEAANTFGVERDYALGAMQTWNLELSRPFRTVWTASGAYTGKRGAALDLIRTPNRDPESADFRWQTSQGASTMHGMTFRLQRRKAHGVGGTVSYTLARSRDNMAIAQNDADLESEWSLSSFDRRHQVSADLAVDLPFGAGRPWITRGVWASLLGGWHATASLTLQSGTPLTPRVTGAQAANRPLRPDLTGLPIQLASPTIDLFFNTAAFSLPDPGRFGTAGRNAIIGPGSRLLNASVARDLRLGSARVLTARLDANNLLNLVNYSAVNTTVNSSAFGQVTSVRPLRTMTASLQVRF